MMPDREPGGFDLPSVLVLGGGRWARVIAETLLGLLTESTPLLMASPAGARDLVHWIEQKGYGHRIAIVERHLLTLPRGAAVVVANAARGHVEAASWALRQGASVLVEKPLALTVGDARLLERIALQNNALLAPALVFRFAQFIDDFAMHVASGSQPGHVELVWQDGAAEHRHGEEKRYDPGVSVIEDCLPHALAIFASTIGTEPQLVGLDVQRGGARVDLKLADAAHSFAVTLERNGPGRRRIMRATSATDNVELDFTAEPGLLRHNGVLRARSLPSPQERPLAHMLRVFLSAATGGAVDARLSMQQSLHSAQVIEHAMSAYRIAALEQLESGLDGADLNYAMAELLQREGRLTSDQLELAAAALRRRLAEREAAIDQASIAVMVRNARDEVGGSG